MQVQALKSYVLVGPVTYIIVRYACRHARRSFTAAATETDSSSERWYIGIFNWLWKRDGTHKCQHMWVLHYPPAPAVEVNKSQWIKEPPESRCQVKNEPPDSIQVRANGLTKDECWWCCLSRHKMTRVPKTREARLVSLCVAPTCLFSLTLCSSIYCPKVPTMIGL